MPMRRNMVIAKVLIVTFLGIVLGYAAGFGVAARAKKTHALTLEQHTAEYEKQKKEALDTDIPVTAAVVMCALLMIGFFAVYELFSFGLAKILDVIMPEEDAAR